MLPLLVTLARVIELVPVPPLFLTSPAFVSVDVPPPLCVMPASDCRSMVPVAEFASDALFSTCRLPLPAIEIVPLLTRLAPDAAQPFLGDP